jgi:hypothetical protein
MKIIALISLVIIYLMAVNIPISKNKVNKVTTFHVDSNEVVALQSKLLGVPLSTSIKEVREWVPAPRQISTPIIVKIKHKHSSVNGRTRSEKPEWNIVTPIH